MAEAALHLYLISGLGADRRLFEHLRLPEYCQVHYLDWLQPLPRESLPGYCRRMAASIDTSRDFVLIGLSFGGMVAAELSTMLHPLKTIIISSASNRLELPWYFRLAGRLRLHLLLAPVLMRLPAPLMYGIFGARQAADRALLQYYRRHGSPRLIRWSLDAILNWQRRQRPAGLLHIHGTADRLLPIRYTRPDLRVAGGGHLMVWQQAGELSSLLGQLLQAERPGPGDVLPA